MSLHATGFFYFALYLMNMKQVAKIVVVDDDNNYLMLWRSDHPNFSNDPDLPGGIVEVGESSLDAMLREVIEETGFAMDKKVVKKLYSGVEYSAHHTHYSLYVAKLTKRPQISISWEHSSYKWLDRSEFLEIAKCAKDTYMHMVYDFIKEFNL